MNFFISQFTYSPLFWMFHSRRVNHKINKPLRIVYKDQFLSFEILLFKDKSVTVYQRNTQVLAAGMHKILNVLFPDIIQDIFKRKSNYYNTSNAPVFSSRNIKTVRYGLQTISYMGLKRWVLIPKEMSQVTTLNKFKAKIVPTVSVELTFCRYTSLHNVF